jgi:hypothetical protein
MKLLEAELCVHQLESGLFEVNDKRNMSLKKNIELQCMLLYLAHRVQ